ncbi:DUF1513 domain-containing protein [Vannielia sp.]|uniref:DUF1513 domain-containing protein n=1 Tax=Vannielia sp. TaxID=2813045 RepID=UPI00261581E1|nr:DUF1513 domain-containing protein [Vannielia sp.]MDF1871923.1 DUF1513 domain-containing protein [Vannielia sp.]
MTTRRTFLASLAAAAAAPRATWADAGAPAVLAAGRDASGNYTLSGLSSQGAERFRISLPSRGHAAAAHPTRPQAVAFARRPGRFARVVDCPSGQIDARLDAPEGRHFYGHGAFLHGGEMLATSENDIATGAGVIGLWAPDEGYTRIGEFASGGIGPHEILALAQDRLVIANGGIRTHPDSGREKLNLPTMRPNLSLASPERGVLDQAELAPELHLSSIRHIALGPAGQIALAMQWQGDVMDAGPLLGLWTPGTPPHLCEAPPLRQMAMQGYAGSVAFSGDGKAVAISSPRGGEVQIFEAATGSFLNHWQRPDTCGLAPLGTGFLTSDGAGGMMALDTTGKARLLAHHPTAWDNHIIPLNQA